VCEPRAACSYKNLLSRYLGVGWHWCPWIYCGYLLPWRVVWRHQQDRCTWLWLPTAEPKSQTKYQSTCFSHKHYYYITKFKIHWQYFGHIHSFCFYNIIIKHYNSTQTLLHFWTTVRWLGVTCWMDKHMTAININIRLYCLTCMMITQLNKNRLSHACMYSHSLAKAVRSTPYVCCPLIIIRKMSVCWEMHRKVPGFSRHSTHRKVKDYISVSFSIVADCIMFVNIYI